MATVPPVAIVGMAVLLPGAPDLESYWRNLVDGVDAITDVPAHRWDPEFYDPAGTGPDRVYCRRGGFVDAYAEVDAAGFGIMPHAVAGTEPDQLIALRVAAAAIADAGGPDRLGAPDRVGVVLGRGGYLTPGLVRLDQRVRTTRQLVRTLAELLPEVDPGRLDQVREAFLARLGPDRPEAAIGLVPNLAASRVANRLDLRGPAYTVDAACASSLIAVDQAVAELATGRCDTVLAGGVHHCHDITLWSVFAQLRALSRRQAIRPFDRRADGILIGEGTGVVVLKRLADADRDGDRVYAVVRGTGVASDGRGASLFNPEPAGQARAVRRAWAAAGLDPTAPGALGLLEAHGTGTPAGDTAELVTVADVFGPPGAGPRAVIGSVKSMIGHAMPAAGVAGLVKAALAVHRGVLPPTLHCDDPRPELDRTRFAPTPTAQPWERGNVPRRAGVNAFGFGGINAHVLLEEPPDTNTDTTVAVPVRPPSPTAEPVTPAATEPEAVRPAGIVAQPGRSPAVIAESERVLRMVATDHAALAGLLDVDDATVRALWSGVPGPGAEGCRLGIVDPTARRLGLARRIAALGQAWRGRSDIWFSPTPLLRAGKAAFVFPGLEAEFTPRIDDVAAHFGLAAADHSAATVGRHGAGVIAVGRLLAQALRRIGIAPDAVAGHSVGEWTAMISAGLYSGAAVDRFLATFDPDAVRVPGLVFAAVGAGADRVTAALAAHPGVVLSHDNAPNQSIVCGPRDAVEALVGGLRREQVLCQVLPFRSGFHTPMLAPYLGPIRRAAREFELNPPAVPVWSATTAAPFPGDPAAVQDLFMRHLVEPVRFRPLIEAMYAAGIRVFVQVGTGQLATVIGDVLHGRDHLAVPANVPRRTGLAQLRRVATALWVEGAAPDTGALDRPRSSGAIRLDLGGATVSLGPDARTLLTGLSTMDGPLHGHTGRLDDPLHGRTDRLDDPLRGFTDHLPAAAELAALLRETAANAAAVLATRTPPAHPAPNQPPARPHQPAPSGSRQAPGLPRPDAGTGDREHRTVLHVSVRTMPHLLDHCFFRQRDGWPDDTDRWPVVPATAVIEHMMTAAEGAVPGTRAVAVHGARFSRWVVAAPGIDVPVTVRAAGAGRAAVSFGPYAQAEVELAAHYPIDTPPPWEPGPEQRPEIAAADLYRDRWMFHGPRYQGLSTLDGISGTTVRGILTTPPAPGALLDNVGQLLGYWIMATHATRRVVFPVGMERIRFFGPHPPPGAALECRIRIRSVTDTALTADAQLIRDGRVWAEITGWVDRRFDSHPETRAVEQTPEHSTLSRRQPGGWALLYERWPDLASRDLILRNHLGAAERADHDRCPPRARRHQLLDRIAIKDAVRHHLWDTGAGPLFPAEVAIHDLDGRPRITGVHGRALPDYVISVAHCAEIAVAMARPHNPTQPGIGIAVVEVPTRVDDKVLSGAEAAVLDAARAGTGEKAVLWSARFRAAREAAGEAAGGGPAVVTAAGHDGLVVTAGDGVYRVRCAVVANPEDLPARQYVVAWTTGPGTEDEEVRA